jgi:hypothetical protein
VTRHLLDLCVGRGGFSRAFAQSDDWRVTTLDVDPDHDPDIVADLLETTPADLPTDVDGVVVGHPCTFFSTAGHHDDWDHEAREPTSPAARRHVAMVHHAIGLAKALTPDWWVFENPVGRLRWILGRPAVTITQCQYGESYRKATDLWGDLPDGFDARWCPPGAPCHTGNTDGDGTSDVVQHMGSSAARAELPMPFSRALLRAAEGRGAQATLPEVADAG